MKTLKGFLLLLCCLITTLAYGQQTSVVEMAIQASGQQDVWDVAVRLDNPSEDNFTAFQINLTIPKGFKMVESSLKPSARLLEHTCAAQILSNGKLRVLAYSATNAKILGTGGELFRYSIQSERENFKGEMTVRTSGVTFTDREGKTHILRNSFKSIQVGHSFEVIYQVDGVEFARQKVWEEQEIPPLTKQPQKEGYTFMGWDGLTEVMPSNDLVVNALFKVNTYTITYWLDGKEFARQEVDFGTKIVPPVVEHGPESVFEGWEELPETMPAHDLNIYGKTKQTGIAKVWKDEVVEVYDLSGRKLLSGMLWKVASRLLSPGIYVVNGKTVLLK